MIFIIASDDEKWCKAMFGSYPDVVLSTLQKSQHSQRYTQISKSGIRELAILSQCNHSIITYGTYSFWTAYLKPARPAYHSITVMPTGYSAQPHPIMLALKLSKFWKGMDDSCFMKHENGKIILSDVCIENAKKYGIDSGQLKRSQKNNAKIIDLKFSS